MAPGDGGLPAWHFTTQLDGPSETLLSARMHIGRKTVKGNGSMEEEHNRAAKGQLVARVPSRSSVSGSLLPTRNVGKSRQRSAGPREHSLDLSTPSSVGQKQPNGTGQGSLAPFYMATDDAKSGSQ